MRLPLAWLLIASFACSNHSGGKAGDALPIVDTPVVAHGPNIVLILTDDLDVGVYKNSPRMQQLMDMQGTSFLEHFLNISLCCPSRTAILRGQYAHNTMIFSNAPPTGGFETFYANGSEADTLPVWLKAAGYKTVLMGKYLNGYPNTAPANYIPPGWTEWYSPVSGDPYGEYNYGMNENGTVKQYGATPADYMVDVIAGKAVDFIQRTSATGTPFFMYIAPFSPHMPATPAPRYANDFPGATAPRTPSFNQADVSKMPTWVQQLPLLTPTEIAAIDALYRKRLQSMEGIEDMVSNVIDALSQAGQLSNTYIVFTSDNGFHQGQHRLLSGKNTEFDEDLFVPLIVRGPGIAAGATMTLPTLNVDFAPTFLDLAGVPIPAGVDGRSFAPVLAGTTPPTWRDAVLLEHAAAVQGSSISRESVRTTLEPPDYEIALGAPPPAPQEGPPFVGIRTSQYTYIEYNTGEKELYDHTADPAQMTNIAATANPTMLTQLGAIIRALDGCKGAACRTAEEMTAP